MNVLLLAGISFVTPYAAEYLTTWGHTVTVFSDEQMQGLPDNVTTVVGDHRSLADYSTPLQELQPDVIVDLRASTGACTRQLLDVFHRSSERLVVVSSTNVYRAYGRFILSEPGEPDLIPLLENDPLRSRAIPGEESNDPMAVETIIRQEAAERSTIIRLPTIYGPGEPRNRFRDYLSQMDGGSEEIRLPISVAEWRSAIVYVSDAGLAVALCAKNKKALGTIYNVADSFAFSERDFIEAISRASKWNGKVTVEPDTAVASDRDYQQHLVVDSSSIRQNLGYLERLTINEAFRLTVEWERYRQQ